jgi:hypothetical protein
MVRADPAHPYVPNGTGAQPTYRIGDLSNSNLKPWVKERMKRDNEDCLPEKSPLRSALAAGRRAFPAS